MLKIYTPDPALTEQLESLRRITGVGDALELVDSGDEADLVLEEAGAEEARKLWAKMRPDSLRIRSTYPTLYAELTEQPR